MWKLTFVINPAFKILTVELIWEDPQQGPSIL